VIDPGVWISALIGKPGAPDELLEAATEGRIVVLVSPMLLAELQEVIERSKFGATSASSRAGRSQRR